MKNFSAIFLSTFLIALIAEYSHEMTLTCAFTNGPFYTVVGYVYQCKVQSSTTIKTDYKFVDNINGLHQDVNSNLAVDMLWVWGTDFFFIPRGLGHHFQNLKALWIQYAGLKVVTHENLQQFPKLVVLSLAHNNLQILKSDLLKSTPKIEYIDLNHNKLKFIDGELFKPLKLVFLNLLWNECIDEHYYSKPGKILHLDIHLEIQRKIDLQCHLAEEIFCYLEDVSHQGIHFYTCTGKGTNITERNVSLLRVLYNKDPVNIQAILIRYQTFKFFPLNLHKFLSNLSAIQIIGSELEALTANDLKHYPELRSLWLPLNKIEVLENEVFGGNCKLEKLSLYGNRLKLIESHVLIPLQHLKFASFEKNLCIDMASYENDIFNVLNKEIGNNCNQA